MLCRENQLLIEVRPGSGGTSTGEPVTSDGEYVDGLRDYMQKSHDIARQYLCKMLWEWKSYDVKWSLTHGKPGKLVLYGTESSQLDVVPKQRMKLQGPDLVLAKLGDLDYRIQLDAKGK